ncbi:MAG: SUMF1/EgtB/PvdO family nonheme iron enzyme [Desulfobacterales bacterium]|nr:SUMF1/EgtB/PvdO family nonheme iron enzyme [Desulfobacterales bacterium]
MKFKLVIWGIVFLGFAFWIHPGVVPARENPEISSLKIQAARGDTRAMCDLAKAYYHGRGVLKDPLRARCWVERAHGAGSPKAQRLWDRWELWQYAGDCNALLDGPALPQPREGEQFREPVSGMVFVWVPGGCFKMGCPLDPGDCEADELPVHKVCLDGFWMGETEVTQAQWEALTGKRPSRFRSRPDHPVEQVSYQDIQDLIQILNGRTRHRFFLPTEAQWEYAARDLGRGEVYPWGEEAYMAPANCGTCDAFQFRGRTAPVASFYPNALGLYDMGGNVAEWCRDGYLESAYGKHRRNNPWVRRGRERVVRGGSWADNAEALRSTRRDQLLPAMKSDRVGFRLVLERK